MSGITVARLHRPHAHFTNISNDFLRHPDIPLGAFRVACYVLSHADEFVLTQARIGEAVGMHRNTVAPALRWLEDNGFALSIEVRNAQGHKVGTRLYVSDIGITDEDRAALCTDFVHRPEPADPMHKISTSPCTKSVHHKKTNSKKTTTGTPVLDVTPERARDETDSSPRGEGVKTTRRPPKPRSDGASLRQMYQDLRAAARQCAMCDDAGVLPDGHSCPHDAPRGAPARAQRRERGATR